MRVRFRVRFRVRVRDLELALLKPRLFEMSE